MVTLDAGAECLGIKCESWVSSVAYIPALRAIVCGDSDQKVNLFDAATGSTHP